jgi:predicted secreted protein
MRRFNEEANGAEVAIPIGETFEICLSENPTAGFRWKLEPRGEPSCVLVSEHFSQGRESPGSQGIHCWNFKALAHGTSTIELTYQRRWQEAPPARTFRLEIRAGDRATRDE